MTDTLQSDANQLDLLLNKTLTVATDFLHDLPNRPAGAVRVTANTSPTPTSGETSETHQQLPQSGLGAERVLEIFNERYMPGLTGSAGPRYWGFVRAARPPRP